MELAKDETGLSLVYGVVIYLNAKNVEEPELKKRFGYQYDEYLKKVPRLFPNPFKYYK